MTCKRIGPGESANSTRASKKKSTATLSRITREIAAILAIGAMVGVMFWQSVFGMSGQFGPGPDISINERLAAGGADGR